MAASSLGVVLGEGRLTEVGVTPRSLPAQAGQALEVVFVSGAADLEQAVAEYSSDLVPLELLLLQPEALARFLMLCHAEPSNPLIVFDDPADKTCVVTCLATGAKDFMQKGHAVDFREGCRGVWDGSTCC